MVVLDHEKVRPADLKAERCGCLKHTLCIICKVSPCQYERNGLVRERDHGYPIFRPCANDRVLWIENEYLSPSNSPLQLKWIIKACTTEQRVEALALIRGHLQALRSLERDFRLLSHEAL